MLERPLRVGVTGDNVVARGVAKQVGITDGMELVWRCPDNLEKLANLLRNEPIDVLVEAFSDLTLAIEAPQMAILHNAHILLTDPRVDAAAGLALQAQAYERGLIVTSDAGTPHGSLANLIQEAHIMGFAIVQAGQITPLPSPASLPYEMAALANGFGFLPPADGMTGPEVTQLDELLTAFDLSSYQDTPRVDFARSTNIPPSLYLIVKAKNELNEEQASHLRNCQLGDGPYYLLHRNFPLGFFETPKAILGASAGQAILSPGFPTCEVYAQSISGISEPSLLPYSDNLVPHFLLAEDDKSTDREITIQNTTLPDSPLTHLWIEQRKLIESQTHT